MLGSTAGCSGILGGGSSGSETLGVLTTLDLDVGKATVRGAELGAQVANDEGILDSDLSVESSNTEGTASSAVDAHNTLVSRQGADATIGTFAEQTAAGIMDEIAETETVHLNVGAAAPALAGQVAEDYERYKPWFRIAPINAAFFVADLLNFAEQFAVGQQGWENAVIFREDAAWTGQVAPALKDAVGGLGMSIEDDIVFSLSENNFTTYMNQIDDTDVDFIFGLVAEAGKGPLLSYEESGVEKPMVGDLVASQSPQYLADINTENSNVISRTFTTWGSQLSDAAQEFVDMYESEYDSRPTKPTWAAFGSYVATQMYARARSEGGDSLDDTVTAMEEETFELNQTYSVYGPDEEAPDGNSYPHDLKYGPDFFQPTWSQWRDGEQVTVYPDKFANAEFELQ
ncbi:ABC transporter substrate-binding protein [Halovenus salina]|uniref:ABC transporter substrate-binding protein n=1 Tax=Halovenus salina TaxID=1510225 RepID=UPI002260CE6C|nr:ABC transporter substrate-binding protein [Halovenus salina]